MNNKKYIKIISTKNILFLYGHYAYMHIELALTLLFSIYSIINDKQKLCASAIIFKHINKLIN